MTWRSYDDGIWPIERLTIDVHEDDEVPQFTGLYDAHGRKLYRHPPRRHPVGFDLRAVASSQTTPRKATKSERKR